MAPRKTKTPKVENTPEMLKLMAMEFREIAETLAQHIEDGNLGSCRLLWSAKNGNNMFINAPKGGNLNKVAEVDRWTGQAKLLRPRPVPLPLDQGQQARFDDIRDEVIAGLKVEETAKVLGVNGLDFAQLQLIARLCAEPLSDKESTIIDNAIDHMTSDTAKRLGRCLQGTQTPSGADLVGLDEVRRSVGIASARPKTIRRATGCAAGRDGDCNWNQCPQLHDGEPGATGRHCPLDKEQDDD